MKNDLIIESKDNKSFKYLKSLLNKKQRTLDKIFFVEGIKVLEEALKYKIPMYIAVSDTFNKSIVTDLILKYQLNNVVIYYFKNTIFKQLTDTENSQGIIAYFKHIHINGINEIENGKYAFLDDLQDPGNVGGLIRSADAFSLDGIILSKNTVELYNPKLIRSTMASVFRVKLYIVESKNEILKLKEKGFKIISTSVENAKASYEYKFSENSVITFGNEAKGVSDEVFSYSDEKIYIPMSEEINSLNVNVAASILFYEMNR
ncbi:RNA methyltransferase [Peptoniphilus sp. oral taxon 386]|uniref:TrmH family RNA methyltransferase n=1 Tax=Peptoniphilus sp. oral taxon 386 TaxID=652713 RepID=UPI0001DA9C6D|nr:RNA methyltransferase [Peptoniphilus sp. oral taxon 386]EFI42223.1 RNA methyltransferase, TrmH family [Peptoniphilus sp. oral taxon 386 str. F0131]